MPLSAPAVRPPSVPLIPGVPPLPQVAFARGQERHVYFAIKGLPAGPGVHADGESLDNFAAGPPPPAEALAASVPVVVVADVGNKVDPTGKSLFCGSGALRSWGAWCWQD